ncbi:putative copper resistance protein D [Halopolyspora algeriensis]|uniref:Putative copper resistance protein D n=1 Tax=Halopolyspora algeriensis TaxID=1500506 RepID=A0A368VS02_9ACTN|nr:cytochrome c oxidase assembly protein [Halopolyspora algeriensis]RCW43632.1 putative copper resistance protein D [Halopolyspora algeriensis]TQM47585.1 putative copper resistance protein D [Halopolyspora algeriensis]
MPDSVPTTDPADSRDSRTDSRAATPGRSVALAWMATGVIGAVAVITVLVLTAGSTAYTVLGYADPGVVTKVGVNLLRWVVDVAGAACVGSLVFSAFFTAPQQSGIVSADGYAALRFGGGAAWVWFGATLLMTVFDTADSAGQPVSEVASPEALLGLLGALDAPKAWLLSALLSLIVAVSCHVVLRWRTSMALAGVAAVGLLPPVFVSHSASNAGHDYATNSLVFHVLAASVWLGVLIAVAAHLRRRGSHLESVATRYRRLAAGCWLVLAVSGTIDALVLMTPTRLLGTGYGALVLLKALCLLLLGASGVLARRRITGAARPGGPRRTLWRLVGLDTAIMLITIGVSMGMAHTPPPNLLTRDVTATEVIFGYSLPEAPTLLRFATMWRLDLVLGTAAIVLALGYLLGARRLRLRGEHWPLGRTAAWLGGCATVLIATSSGLGMYAPAVFSVHMVTHVLLNMLAPVLLVLGGPVTLALRALPSAAGGQPYGPREWVLAIAHSPLVRVLTHPVLAAVLLIGSLYGLYLTGLFEAAMEEHWAHQILYGYFLVVGYLYYWAVVGVDATPRQVPHLPRLGIVLGAMPFQVFFGVLVMSMPAVIAGNYYRTLDLPWAPDLLADQRLGGVIGWLAGEVPLMLALAALLWQWHREQRDGDGTGGSEEDAAYTAMLAKMAESRRA